MKFREKFALCDAICEYHWDAKDLLVFVNDYEFDDFMKILKQHSCLFDDEGIPAVIRSGYIAIPKFDEYLRMLGLDDEEINEMFE